MNKIFLTVIIPCYNESENLKRGVLLDVYKYLKTKNFTWEVIISDDGSTDDSRDLTKSSIKKLENFKLLENSHGGKPSALMYGIKKATGKYILFTDMDQSTPIAELDKLLPFAKKGFKVVIGSRGFQRKNFPFYRKLGSLVFTSIRKAFVLNEINDTQCGFKLFDTDLVRKAFPKLQFFRGAKNTAGWKVTSYDVELLHIIKKSGEKIKEIVVTWRSEDESKNKGSGIGRYFRESKEMFLEISRVKINDLKGRYD